MEFFQVEIIAKFFLAGCFQIKEVKVSPVVFQIIPGGFDNILVDFICSGGVGDAESF